MNGMVLFQLIFLMVGVSFGCAHQNQGVMGAQDVGNAQAEGVAQDAEIAQGEGDAVSQMPQRATRRRPL